MGGADAAVDDVRVHPRAAAVGRGGQARDAVEDALEAMLDRADDFDDDFDDYEDGVAGDAFGRVADRDEDTAFEDAAFGRKRRRRAS